MYQYGEKMRKQSELPQTITLCSELRFDQMSSQWKAMKIIIIMCSQKIDLGGIFFTQNKIIGGLKEHILCILFPEL
jgi:hypothetical protein